jgi:hypothetical protein
MRYFFFLHFITYLTHQVLVPSTDVDTFFDSQKKRKFEARDLPPFRYRIFQLQPKNGPMQMIDKKGSNKCPLPFKIPTRNFVKVSTRKRKEDPDYFHVDSIFPEIQGMVTNVIIRPWNGIAGTPEHVVVMRKLTHGVAQYVFFSHESDMFNESTDFNEDRSFWALNLRIFRERNAFSSCKSLHFSPVAFLMSAMHFRVLDVDRSTTIDKMINTFYEQNPGSFKNDKGGPPRYVKDFDPSIGKEAYEKASSFLPMMFQSATSPTKFNHDLGMEFDITLTLENVFDEGWKYPNKFFHKLFEKSLQRLFKTNSPISGEFSVEGYFGGRHCLEVFYQCCMKWRFTTAEWDKAINKIDSLPTTNLSEEVLNARIAYKQRLEFDRQRNIDSFFTLEDWFRALHLAVDGKLSEGPMVEAGSPYLQETVRINMNMSNTKQTSAGDSLHLYPNNNRPREYRYQDAIERKLYPSLFTFLLQKVSFFSSPTFRFLLFPFPSFSSPFFPFRSFSVAFVSFFSLFFSFAALCCPLLPSHPFFFTFIFLSFPLFCGCFSFPLFPSPFLSFPCFNSPSFSFPFVRFLFHSFALLLFAALCCSLITFPFLPCSCIYLTVISFVYAFLSLSFPLLSSPSLTSTYLPFLSLSFAFLFLSFALLLFAALCCSLLLFAALCCSLMPFPFRPCPCLPFRSLLFT